MPENKPEYDLNFILLSFGMIRINANDGLAAITPGAITSMEHVETARNSGDWIIRLHGGKTYQLSPEAMAEMEASIKSRAEETKVLQREAQREAMRNHANMQNELIAEMNNKVQDPRLMAGIPVIGKRLKH